MTRARGYGRQCEYVKESGEQCKTWALTEERRLELGLEEEDLWLCRIHQIRASGGQQAVSREMSRMGKAGGRLRRGDTEPRPSSDVDPQVSWREVAKVCVESLDSFLETGEPDRSARLAACAVLLLSFPQYVRPTMDEARSLLAELLPAHSYDPEQLKAEEMFKALRAEWWSLPAWHPIRGLIARDLPRGFTASWEDYATVVRREAPRDVPPAEAEKRIVRLPSGEVALRREGQLPRLLETVS